MTADSLLQIDHVTLRFGGLCAVDRFSMAVKPKAIHGLIGPNGAGKTSLFNAVSGFYKPSAGRILLHGKPLPYGSMVDTVRRGVVRTFQHTTLFDELTVLESVLVGCHARQDSSFFSSVLKTRMRRSTLEKAQGILALLGLQSQQHLKAKTLSYGHQKAVGIAVALSAEPFLLLLDEPFTGMNIQEIGVMMKAIRNLSQRGMTLLVVEHNMQAVMGLCEIVTVMQFGKHLATGSPKQIRSDPRVIEAYLGKKKVTGKERVSKHRQKASVGKVGRKSHAA